MVAFDLSALVRYITRFTEESFAVLISLIFIFNAFEKLVIIHDKYPIHTHGTGEDMGYKCHCQLPAFLNASDNVTQMTPLPDLQEQSVQDHPIFEAHNWTSLVYEDCITYQGRIVVEKRCITEVECLEHGWMLVGPACNVDSVHTLGPRRVFSSVAFSSSEHLSLPSSSGHSEQAHSSLPL